MKTQSLSCFMMAISIFVVFSCTNAGSSTVEKSTEAHEASTGKKNKATTVKKKSKKKFKPASRKSAVVTRKSLAAKSKVNMPAAEKPRVTEPQARSSNKKEATSGCPDMMVMSVFAKQAKNYSVQNDLSTKYCFLVDMSLPSGRNRFFVYNLEKNSIVYAALVAHGSCNERFRSRPKFSNQANTGCSSLGKYKVGELYQGKYGSSYRLYGLDNSNSGAFKRGVVIHGYECVPDKEIYPMVLCNSLGCPMVSFGFFEQLSRIIKKSDKSILLWIYH